MTSAAKPTRVEGVDVHETADGVVMYDSVRDRVHYLNHTAVLVFELCDGKRTADTIADVVQRIFDLPERPDVEVDDCLEQLRQEGLVA